MFAKMRSVTVMALLAVAMSGCALFGDEDALKPAELVEFEPSLKLERLWTTRTGAGQDARYTRFIPAFADERIFVADYKGRVVALNRNNGKKLWQQKTDLPVSGALGAGAGMVLLGTYKGDVVALSQEDGSELWRAKASTEILAPPQTNGQVVVAQTIDGKLFAYDASTGEQRWSYDHTLPILTFRTTARPLITENRLYVGFDNGQLLSFNPENGVSGWSVRVGQPQGRSDLDRVVDVDASPLLVDSFVYTAAYQGSVIAVSRGTGRIIWKQDASTAHDIAYGNGHVYATLDDSRVVAYSGTSGSVAWQNDQMLRRGLSAPAAFDNYVAVIDDEDYMHVLSQTDGSFAQRFKPPGSGFRSPMMVVDDVLYVLSDNGRLTAYRVPEEN